ncbi:MAG: hypothetical protein ACHQ50_16780 [Fimbriimonadales bacterium]
MLTCAILLAACLANQGKIEPAHAQNAAYNQVLNQGLEAGGQIIRLPEPRLVDGQDGSTQRAALREVAGSDRALDDLLRNSITAPYIIKVHDLKAPGVTIRAADIWFVVHADLKQIDFAQEAARADQKEVEVANMWFQTRLLKAADLRAAGLEPAAPVPGQSSLYSHVHARLLDRIDFEVANHVVASQSAESVVIASRTDPSFAKAGPIANGWKPLAPAGAPKTETPAQPYAGGISYAKISRVALGPGALLVEMHVAFIEPEGWFQGAPILRSKFSIVAQDQIRRLRRELARKKGK